ncbi:MAG: hypothetical protein D6708_12530 [Candidatus Dadabacteria bacterium]|nr:MAG: hypothetical protein D6708_12530 [Candidatus Dadabacteria bacterium]
MSAERITGKDRVKAAFRRTHADRIPSYPILGAYTIRLTGASLRSFYTDARALADGQLAALEAYEPDIVVMMRDLLTEAEAMGTEVEFPEGQMCQTHRYALGEEPERLARLEVPDVRNAGRFPSYWEACERVASQVRDVPVGSLLVGPWTIAANLRGAENLILDAMRRPDYVRDLLELTLQVAVAAAEVARQCGVGVSYSEAAASCSLISPKIYRDLIQPVHRRLTQTLREKKIPVTLHICGFIDPIMEDVVDTGIVALSIDSASSLERMVDVNRGRVVIIGNVPVTTFEQGSPADIEAEVRRCVDTAAPAGGFILSSACELSPAAKPENVAHFSRFAKEYGRVGAAGEVNA